MSPETARQLLSQAFHRLSTARDAEETLLHFDRLLSLGLGVEQAYSENLIPLLSAAVRADYQQLLFGPEYRLGLRPGQEFKDYNNTLPTASIVQLLFPQAPADWQQDLAHQVHLGHFDHNDLLYGWASLPHGQPPTPKLPDFLQYLLEHPHVRAAGLLQFPDLQLPVLALEAQEWLLGIYVAAFNRAPDSSGLHYWAEAYAQLRATGLEHPGAIRLLARDMAWSAEQNQEQGTTLTHHEFVQYYYQQVLGREPDPLGASYWLQALESGDLPRSEFIAVFLNSALLSAGDGGVVKARLAVAAVATHLDQQAPGQIDLAAGLHAVFNPASALAAIAQLQQQLAQSSTAAAAPLEPADSSGTAMLALLANADLSNPADLLWPDHGLPAASPALPHLQADPSEMASSFETVLLPSLPLLPLIPPSESWDFWLS